MSSSRRTWRSQCPVGFEAVDLNDSKDCPVLEDVSGNDMNKSSFWLIKVPLDFDLSGLSGQTTVLNGTQDLPPIVAQNTGKRYEVHSRTDCSAELSSFSVLLPSMQKKSFCVAGPISGQMSVIQSVHVPPTTLPESSLAVHRQIPSHLIKKWKPFGYKKPQHNLSQAKKESKRPSEQLQDGARKYKKEWKTTNLEESIMGNEVSRKKKHDSPKKKKDQVQDRHGVDLTWVKIEPYYDASSQITATNGEQSSTRKRKTEMNKIHQCDDLEDPMQTPSEKRKKRKSEIIVKQEPDETSLQSKKYQDDVSGMGELISLKQEKSKEKPRRNLSQAKEKESKEPSGQLQDSLDGSGKHKKERKTANLEESRPEITVKHEPDETSPQSKKHQDDVPGIENPRRNSSQAKEKESKGPNGQLQERLEGSRKHKKERKTLHLEESIEDNEVSSKKKRDSPKKKKEQERHGVDLTQVKIEPYSDGSSQITATNGKIKTEMNQIHQCDDLEGPILTPSEKRKKRKSEIKVKQEPNETSPQSKKYQDDVSGMGELKSFKQEKSKGEHDFDLGRVKLEPKESTHKKKKHSKGKTF